MFPIVSRASVAKRCVRLWQARLSLAADGQVVLQLRHPWADGTTHVAFTPTAFLERLAVLVPRPHVNLVLYHGVLAPRAAWRAEVVPRGVLGDTPAGSGVDRSPLSESSPFLARRRKKTSR